MRTLRQHFWADLMERLADRLGRQIRYGGEPTPPPGVSLEQAREVVATMRGLSASWAEREAAQDHLSVEAAAMSHLNELANGVWRAISDSLRETGIDLCTMHA